MSVTNTPVLTYPVAHDKNGGGGGGVTYMKGGQGGVPSNLYVNSINASLGNIKHLTTTSLSANDANFIYVTANDGNIYKLKGNDLDFYSGHIANLAVDSISADSLDLKNLTAKKAYIEELVSSNITTKDLTVTGRAHFFELLIDKIRSVGGQIILSPTSCILDYVEYIKNGNIITDPTQYNTADSFKVYWRNTDPYGRAVDNEWCVNDQAICQSFNNAREGMNTNISNKKYWRKVIEKLDPLYINLTTGETRPIGQANTTTYNTIYMGMWDSIFNQDNQDHTNGITWTCAVQTIDDTPVSGVSYSGGTAQTGWAFSGTMNTSNKNFGVKITPSGEYAGRMTNKLKFSFEQEVGGQNVQTIPAKNMNVTVTFADDTFMYFPNVQAKKDANDNYVLENGHYIFELDLSGANMPISIITVNSSQEVDWHLCHGIRLSNGSDATDQWAEGSDCIPEAGDNLVQLGYQGTDDADRQSAIIISAYHSPDTALKAPSYAHYQGINDFKLETHRGSYFDANGARFTGDITFSNIGDLTATDKWMKLNYTSAPIISTMNEDGTRTTEPSTFGLSITSIDDREFVENSTTHEMENNPNFKKTVTYNAIPDGYSIFIYYYDKNGILNYNVPRIYSGDANYGDLSSIAAPNAVEVQGNTKLVMKIVCKLVKGINANANVIDEIEIIYDEKDYWKTDSWCLIPEKEVAYATILNRFDQTGGTETANTQKVNLYVDLQYAAGHYKQGEITNVEFGASSGLFLRARVYYQPTLADSASGAVLSEIQTNNITWSYTNDHIHGSFQVDNYLATLWPNNNNYQDYMKNYTDHRDKNPVMFEIELVDGRGSTDVVLDTRTVYVSLQSGAVMKIMQNAIVSAVSNSKAYTNDVKTELQNDISLVEQYADQISATVTSNYNSLSGQISDLSDDLDATTEQLESNITQTAGMIRTEVKRSYGKSSDRLVSGDTGVYTNTVDLTNTNTYREDRYYEVHIAPYTTSYSEKHEYVFQIERNLESNESSWGKPSYGKQDSPYGFELMYNLSAITDSQGKCNPLSMYVNEYYLNYVSNGIAIGTVSYVQNNDYLYYINLYMRGGSKYTVLTNQSASVTIMPYNYIGSAPTEPVIYKPTMSSIEQTAEKISMYVVETNGVSEEALKRTGIDIENEHITLNADNTDIIGNLNLKRSDNGITIYDSNGNARINILPKVTPSPTAGDDTLSSWNQTSGNSDTYTKMATNNVDGTTNKISLGSYASGNSLQIIVKPAISGRLYDGDYKDNNIYNPTCYLYIYIDNNSSPTYTKTQSVYRQPTFWGADYPEIEWNLSNIAAGDYYFVLGMTGYDYNNGYISYYISAGITYSKYVDSLTFIGTDGILIGESNLHYAKIAKNGFEFRWIGTTGDVYGGTAIRLSNNGLQRVYDFDVFNGPLSWVAFDGYSKAKTLSTSDFTYSSFYYGSNYVTAYNYIVKSDDVNIFVDQLFAYNNSSYDTVYIRLGDGIGGTSTNSAAPGRKLFIRNFSDKTVFVCAGETEGRVKSYCILNREDHDPIDRVDLGHNSWTFMAAPRIYDSNWVCNWMITQRN